MNKRYIDFVPVDKKTAKKPVNSGVAKAGAVKAGVPKAGAAKAGAPRGALEVRKGAPKRVVSKKPASSGAIDEVPLGQIFGEKPLPAGVTASRTSSRAVKKKVGPDGPLITKFLKTDKVEEKRPLSNTYAKRAVVTPKMASSAKIKETEKKAPERIITKPEKDSKAGMIIAVILTIILGAAAGTVAFLLLPK